ncbi:MAG: hypothetical protein HY303_20225, partial [Candidatus Wallbacteria bacterium]|nr:hypothetical protein [Candidatus Wallbacteria bacterium]
AWQGAQATDPDRHLKGDEGTVVVQPRGDHPATGGLAETLLPGVTFFGLPAGDSEWKPLMALSAAGRSTLRQGGPGPTGALVVAAAAERGTGPAPGRRAVVGDTDFFTNGALSKWPVNRELFVNLTDWLSEREDLLGPWLETRESFRVTLTERQLRAAGAVVVLGMPGLLLLVGLYFWLEGRRG